MNRWKLILAHYMQHVFAYEGTCYLKFHKDKQNLLGGILTDEERQELFRIKEELRSGKPPEEIIKKK